MRKVTNLCKLKRQSNYGRLPFFIYGNKNVKRLFDGDRLLLSVRPGF